MSLKYISLNNWEYRKLKYRRLDHAQYITESCRLKKIYENGNVLAMGSSLTLNGNCKGFIFGVSGAKAIPAGNIRSVGLADIFLLYEEETRAAALLLLKAKKFDKQCNLAIFPKDIIKMLGAEIHLTAGDPIWNNALFARYKTFFA